MIILTCIVSSIFVFYFAEKHRQALINKANNQKLVEQTHDVIKTDDLHLYIIDYLSKSIERHAKGNESAQTEFRQYAYETNLETLKILVDSTKESCFKRHGSYLTPDQLNTTLNPFFDVVWPAMTAGFNSKIPLSHSVEMVINILGKSKSA